eukprot:EG_transcript_34230
MAATMQLKRVRRGDRRIFREVGCQLRKQLPRPLIRAMAADLKRVMRPWPTPGGTDTCGDEDKTLRRKHHTTGENIVALGHLKRAVRTAALDLLDDVLGHEEVALERPTVGLQLHALV